jgi:hypothetical protein
MTHLTREELERWWRSDQLADRSRIVGHLAGCDECGALYGEVIEDRVPAPEPPVAAAGNLVARAYRLYGKPLGAHVWRSWTLGLGAAAAVMFLALAIPMLRHEGPRDIAREEGIRGTSLQPLAPIGTVVPPVRFQWASPVAADRFVVEVRDDEQRIVLTLSSATETVLLPDDQRTRLVAGRTYHWQAFALGPAGDEIFRAPVRTFVIAGPVR